MAKRPGEFLEPTKKAIAMRVGYLCSRPECRCMTTGPIESDPNKGYSVGQAAHIYGIGKKAARYDPDIKPEELADASNGIWLCLEHHWMVDRDEKTYPVELLKQWKADAEDHATANIGRIPHLKKNFLENQDFFTRKIKRDIDDCLYFSGYKISYGSIFISKRDILWVKPKIERKPDDEMDVEDILCLVTEQVFLNEIDFAVVSRAVCILNDGKLNPKTFTNPTANFKQHLSFLSAQVFQKVQEFKQFNNHAIEIFSGIVGGQPITIIFDINDFAVVQYYKEL